MSKKQCPEFPFFGADYPDARCVDGVLYDLDNCDGEGNLYRPTEEIPCPFCRPNDFKDHFGMSVNEVQMYIQLLNDKGYNAG